MKRRFFYDVAAAVLLLSVLMSSCAPAAAPAPAATEAPAAATQAPAATEAPTASAAQPTTASTTAAGTPAAQGTSAPAGSFTPMKVTAPDCNYGTADAPAKLKSIEAVDQFTVKFTLCAPDPAFASKVAFSVFGITSKANLDKTAGDSVQMSNQPEGDRKSVV